MFQTLNISVGQTGYIPSNATIITTSSSGDAAASSDCIDLTGEDLGCYGFVVADQNDSGSHTEPFQSNNTFYRGVKVDGVEYLFDEEISYDDSQNTLANTLMNLPGIGSLLIDVQVRDDFDSNYGNRFFIIFKTVPSIGVDITLLNKTSLVWGDNIDMFYEVHARPYQDIIDEHGSDNVPSCTT